MCIGGSNFIVVLSACVKIESSFANLVSNYTKTHVQMSSLNQAVKFGCVSCVNKMQSKILTILKYSKPAQKPTSVAAAILSLMMSHTTLCLILFTTLQKV